MSFMDVVYKADDWLIDRVFQPVVWRLEYYTGKNNFWLARMVLVLFPATSVAVFPPINMFGILITVMVLLFTGQKYVYTLFLESFQNKRFSLAVRYMTRPQRIIGVPFLFLPQIILLLTLGWLGFMVYLYILACSPMPPAWKEEKELKKLRLAADTTPTA